MPIREVVELGTPPPASKKTEQKKPSSSSSRRDNDKESNKEGATEVEQPVKKTKGFLVSISPSFLIRSGSKKENILFKST